MRGAAAARSAAVALAAVLAALVAAPVPPAGALTLEPEWTTPDHPPPLDLWDLGRARPGRAAFVAAAMPPARFAGADDAAGGDGANAGAVRARLIARGRGASAPSPLERSVLPQDRPGAGPLPRHDLDLALARGASLGDEVPPTPDVVVRPADAPDSPWEIEAPSFLFELLRQAPAEIAAQARFGLRDPLRAGLAARHADAAGAPDWPEAILAPPDPVALGAGARRRDVPLNEDEIRATRWVAIGFGVIGGIAAVILGYVLVQSAFKGPRTLRSRRFG